MKRRQFANLDSAKEMLQGVQANYGTPWNEARWDYPDPGLMSSCIRVVFVQSNFGFGC